MFDVELFCFLWKIYLQNKNKEFNITILHVRKWIRVNHYIGFIKPQLFICIKVSSVSFLLWLAQEKSEISELPK